MSLLEKLKGLPKSPLSDNLTKFFSSYTQAVTQNGHAVSEYEPVLLQFLEFVQNQLKSPFQFEPYHERIRKPIDYYQWGLDMLRPLVIFESSKRIGLNFADQIESFLKQGHNVILLANHQTEPDPQAISLLLESTHPKLAEEMIFVAGHRVITDPLAVPFSIGRNLLCIFSKNYIALDPATKQEKMLHNQRTMKKMAQLLSDGGKCIYVAPSGGRDRPNAAGVVEVARFDPQSIEMFHLMAKQVDHPTHFYPLALATYALLPPPNSVEKKIGEKRQAQCTPIHLAFGAEIEMDRFVEGADKRQRRRARADAIWGGVKKLYGGL